VGTRWNASLPARGVCVAAFALLAASALAQPVQKIDIEAYAEGRTIPVSISGFTGEVADALKFDLRVVGFEIVNGDTAQYQITGSNNGRLEGHVVDRLTKTSVLARAYERGSPRAQAHAFADDIVLKLTGQPGIAQTKIAYKGETASGSEVFMADYDGHNPIQLTKDGSIVAAPCWMPGRRVIFYTSYRLGNPDIYSYDLDSGARKTVARYAGLNTSATVSPDGRQVAMIMSKAGSPDLYVANADGTGLRQLTRTKEDESSPCWSPDGHTICYVSRETGKAALYLISAGGGTARRLRVAGVSSPTEPDWSPDGKWIIFTSYTGTANFNLCRVPAEGGTAEVLAAGEDPSWAANSRTVIFAKRVRGKRILSLLDVPTKRVFDGSQNVGSRSQPSWSK
jgi:TolB protein